MNSREWFLVCPITILVSWLVLCELWHPQAVALILSPLFLLYLGRISELLRCSRYGWVDVRRISKGTRSTGADLWDITLANSGVVRMKFWVLGDWTGRLMDRIKRRATNSLQLIWERATDGCVKRDHGPSVAWGTNHSVKEGVFPGRARVHRMWGTPRTVVTPWNLNFS